MLDELEALGLSYKWKKSRDSVKRLSMASNPSNGAMEYKANMKKLQFVIKGVADKYEVSHIDAIIAICDQEDNAILINNFLAAGYELVSGNDFTVKSEE